MCPLGLTFFGLTPNTAPQIRKALFTQLHNIVFHGKGGYDYNTIYSMPIWLRKFTFSEINNFYTDENQKIKEASEGKGKGKKTLVNSDGKINTPEFARASQQYKKAEQNLKKFKGKTSFR